MSKFKPRRPAPPPPNMPAETQLRGYFERVDANKSGTITPAELQKALVNGNGTEFNMVTIDSMISLFDKDKSGEICYTEFGALWRYVVDWQNCFKAFDKDKSGTINQSELQEALTTFGYNLSPQVQMKYHLPPAQQIAKPQSYLLKVTPNVLKAAQVYRLLLRKFDRTGRQAVCFDDFIQCCLVMQGITDMFRSEDHAMTGQITINYETFITMLLNSPLL